MGMEGGIMAGKSKLHDNEVMKKYEFFKKNVMSALFIADKLYDAIYVIDKNETVVDANKMFENIAGLKKDRLIGINMQDLWNNNIYNTEEVFVKLTHKDKMPDMLALDGKNQDFENKKPKAVGVMVLEEKKKISIITRIERKNMTVVMTGIPYFNQNKEVEWVVTVIRDISEIIDLKEKLEEIKKDKKVYLNELNYLRRREMETNLIGKSAGMRKVRKSIKQVSKTDATVLITGESGVGKEVVAKEIYKNSLRKDKTYIKINCAAIPETLLESELFGYEKGAFTGAQQKGKIGLLETANHGTILLDEIGDMPLVLQSKILRVIQEKEIMRLGSTESMKLDIRIIAATNQNLQEQIKKGTFRKDLYYRLNVFSIRVMPLRERREDIPILACYFLEKYNKKYKKHKKFENSAIRELQCYDWPGNIRELENIVERLSILDDNTDIRGKDVAGILGKNLLFGNVDKYGGSTLKNAVNLFEKDIIERTLKKCGSTYKAANLLGIDQSTVVKKAKALGIEKW